MTLDQIFENINNCYKVFGDLIIDKNFEIIDGHSVSWKNYTSGISDLLYVQEYEYILNNRQFSLLLLDDSIIQVYYKFNKEGLSKLRLAFYPSPSLETFGQDDIENYFDESINDYLKDQYLFFYEALGLGYRITNTNHFRIDYDKSAQSHFPNHLQFGGINAIRIPLSKQLMPFIFIDFIIRNIFPVPFKKISKSKAFRHLYNTSTERSLSIDSIQEELSMYVTMNEIKIMM